MTTRDYLLLLLLCSFSFVEASQTSVRSEAFVLKSYALEGTYNFEADEAYPVVHAEKDGYYLHLKAGHDTVVFVPKDEASLPARPVGDTLKFWDDYRIEAERAFLAFPPERWYRVLSESDSKYKIEYVFGETKMHLSVEKEGFESAQHIRDEDGRLVDRHVKDPKQAICLIDFQSGVAGTGFLLYRGDKLYCYTNQHVAMNLGKMSISLIDGSVLQQGSMQVAEDSDLARIEILTERPGFDQVGTARLGNPVKVLGNTLGAGRITELKGRVTGMSQTQVETSAKFVMGNSGSPILGEGNTVLGVATLLEHFPDHQSILKGTAFEDGRRVGMRLDREIEWVDVDMGYFVSRNRLVLQTMLFIEELPHAMALAVSDNFSQKLARQKFQDPSIRQWLRARAAAMRAVKMKHKPVIARGLARHGNAFYYSPEYAKLQKAQYNEALKVSRKNWNALSRKLVAKRRTLAGTKAYPDTSYMRESIQRSIEMLETGENVIELIGEAHREFSELQ